MGSCLDNEIGNEMNNLLYSKLNSQATDTYFLKKYTFLSFSQIEKLLAKMLQNKIEKQDGKFNKKNRIINLQAKITKKLSNFG